MKNGAEAHSAAITVRLLTEIRDLLSTVTNEAPMQPAEPKQIDPSTYDVAKTIQMLFDQHTGFKVFGVGRNAEKNTAGGEFNYGTHRYVFSVERF